MTARAFFTVGVSDLTSLNRRLLAVGSMPATFQTDEATNSLIPPEDQGRGVDPDAADQTTQRSRNMSSDDPLEFYTIREWLKREVFGGDVDLDMPILGAFIEAWDTAVRNEAGLGPTDDTSRGATLEQLVNDERFLRGASWLPVTAKGLLPPVFTTESESVDAEGNATTVPFVRVLNPLTGVEFTEVTVEVASDPSNWATAMGSAWRKIINADPFSEVAGMLIGGAREAELDISGGNMGKIGLVAPGALDPSDWQLHVARYAKRDAPPVPHIAKETLLEMRQAPERSVRRGGSTTRRDISFDRAHLVSQVESLWHDWFLEPGEAPSAAVGSIVDGYIREARAFWSGKGGQLDFDTYVRDKLRTQPRWDQIYAKKLPGQTEEEFLASFQRPIEQLGQTAGFTRSQTEAAVTSGGSPTEQLKRVMGTREVQATSGFSSRLAQTLRGLGPM